MPYAVSINEDSLELIATNNGGLAPQIEKGPNGHPGTYFIIPDNPNDHAEIVPIEQFFEKYEFIGPEALDEFRPIRLAPKVRQITSAVISSSEPYSISRWLLARMVAAHTCGMYNAIPEQTDYEHADAMIAFLEERLRD